MDSGINCGWRIRTIGIRGFGDSVIGDSAIGIRGSVTVNKRTVNRNKCLQTFARGINYGCHAMKD